MCIAFTHPTEGQHAAGTCAAEGQIEEVQMVHDHVLLVLYNGLPFISNK